MGAGMTRFWRAGFWIGTWLIAGCGTIHPEITSLAEVSPGSVIVVGQIELVPPLQVQPLLRATYNENAHSSQEIDGLGVQEDGEPAMSPHEWQAYGEPFGSKCKASRLSQATTQAIREGAQCPAIESRLSLLTNSLWRPH